MVDTRIDFELPGDLRFLFHRLDGAKLTGFLVGPAVRDLLTDGDLARTNRIDLLVAGGSLRDLEQALTAAAGDHLFVSPPQRFRRGMSFELRGGKGETVRRIHASLMDDEADLEDVLGGREVTVNAMALDLRGNLFDPFGGAGDLADRILRPMGAADRVFRERPLTILKVAKNAAFHGLEPPVEVVEAGARDVERILDVPPDAWRAEFERMLLNRNPDQGLRFLKSTGALRLLLPELHLLSGFEKTCRVHHKDIFTHTLAVVRQAKPTPAVRWAALLHDLGKRWTRSVATDGTVHFFRHEEVSAHLARGVLARFRVEAKLSERVEFLVRHHSRITLYSDEWTESAVRRLIKDLGEHLPDLLALARADVTSRREHRVEEIRRMSKKLEARVEEVRRKDAYVPPLAKGFGSEIIDFFGLEPGPVVGRLRRRVEEAVEAGELERDQPSEVYLAFLAEELKKDSQA